MKEFEYKDIAGLESTSTPRQLDTFEAPGNKNLRTRYIFDFTLPLGQSGGISSDTGSKWIWENLAYLADNWDLATGLPGNANIMVHDMPVWKNNYPTVENGLSLVTQTIKDIRNEKDVPYWNENAIIYLDENIYSTYGSNVYNNVNYVKSFRSGYIEFTFKTDKNNCLIGYGSQKKTNYGGTGGDFVIGSSEAETAGNRSNPGTPIVIDAENAYMTKDSSNVSEMSINLKNGKLYLNYSDQFGTNIQNFELLGNKVLSDNNWHHVLINFGKPGVLKENGKKESKKFIEFWVDGQLDAKDCLNLNNTQTFFPLIEWLMMNPILAGNLTYRQFNDAMPTAFRGSINHFIIGFNYPLTHSEIKNRFNLYSNVENFKTQKAFTVNAELISPTVLANKKKALKLFWNNLIDFNAKNGIELDNNFSVDSYSVTHKTINSVTEINNVDIANTKEIKYLKDVRIALKDNILLWGPGRESYYNRTEVWNAQLSDQVQVPGSDLTPYDAINSIDGDFVVNLKPSFSSYSIKNMKFSGVELIKNDRILLTNQFNPEDNGIYIFNGLDLPLTRAEDAISQHQLSNAVVRVIDGYYKDTSWTLASSVNSLNDPQNWIELEYHPSNTNINSQPIFLSRWVEEKGIERFIDLEQDINISNYDLIVFMNYPETNEEIKDNFVGYSDFEIKTKYDNFIKSLQNVCAQGANLYVSSPKLAQDLKIIKNYELIDQMLETSDAQSAAISPFEINEPADQYFDTHRINQYQLQTEVPGLTDKETYILTDFINYVPSNINEPHQYHAKYAYRQLGLKEGNQFFIPSFSLLKIAENDKLPGFKANRRGTKPFVAVEPVDVLAGTIVTKLQNTYYQGSQAVTNPHDDDATTIIVHNGQILDGQPITGKIFVNFVEDGYTMSREEYNKAIVQVIPVGDTNETVATRAWQYSTSRLNRSPKRTNVRELTEYGQTTPTNGGGGPLIQASTNSSNGIIRSESDRGNVDYQSDLYTNESEEIYELQEIPVLSMTYLGLQWLAE